MLSVAVVVLVHVTLDRSDPRAGMAGGLLAVSMTLPVLVARRSPVLAAGIVAVAAVLNGLAVVVKTSSDVDFGRARLRPRERRRAARRCSPPLPRCVSAIARVAEQATVEPTISLLSTVFVAGHLIGTGCSRRRSGADTACPSSVR